MLIIKGIKGGERIIRHYGIVPVFVEEVRNNIFSSFYKGGRTYHYYYNLGWDDKLKEGVIKQF